MTCRWNRRGWCHWYMKQGKIIPDLTEKRDHPSLHNLCDPASVTLHSGQARGTEASDQGAEKLKELVVQSSTQ